MVIGVPTEIKPSENRVAMTPACVKALVNKGHTVYIQSGAGINSAMTDEEYVEAGGKMLQSIEQVYESADMIVKVKEPIEREYRLIQENQLVFTYFHFASHEPLARAMKESKSICLAYETVQLDDGSLPLLVPMSEVAGRMAVQEGAKFLEKPMQGKGVLLGGVPGVPPAEVVIIGGGIVGTQAAKMAAGLGARVTILDVDLNRLRYLADVMPANVITMYSNAYNVYKVIQTADLIVGAVLIPGAKAPKLITRDMLKYMQPGTVLVDVAIDQGGCIETARPTTHDDPIYVIDDVVHYCVANMPGAVPFTSTTALTNATLSYALQLANKGWKRACLENPALKKGLNMVRGEVVYSAVAEAFDMPYTPIDKILS